MYQEQKRKHLFLKIFIGCIVLFLVVIAVKDWSPAQVTVEKTVMYANK